ncbi:transposase [Eubacterium barkeri]|uniref:Transposase n=1 Tax=Eubacterium barkeri TaxID=1528 RepID=A0A1H3CY74_EUBBA|nr:transposase [Eubacterium barkeri]SDX59026.1 transposase [Eubacterium barkeri]
MAKNRQYDSEYKIQAVKLAKEISQSTAAKELGIPKNTLYSWMRSCRLGKLDLGPGSQTPTSAMSLTEELISLRQHVKVQDKEIRRLKEFWRKPALFSPRAVGNQQERKNEVHCIEDS